MRLKKNQNGFSAVDTVLIILVVISLSVIGYLIWHNHHVSTTAKSAVTPSNQAKTYPQIGQTSTPKYLIIAEWKVRAPYNSSLNLEYKILSGAGNGPAYAAFSSTQLDASDPYCKVDLSKQAGYGGVVARYLSNEDILQGDAGIDSGQTAANYAATLSQTDYGHVGDYYFFLQSPQAACGSSQNSQNLQGQTTDAVKALLPNLQVIPQ